MNGTDELDFGEAEFSAEQKPAAQDRPSKLKKGDLYRAVVRIMRRQFVVAPWRPFPRDFRVVKDDRGDVDYCEVNPVDEVQYVSKTALVNEVVRYIELDCPHIYETVCKASDVNEILLRFTATTVPLDLSTVRPVREADEPGLTLRRLPWNLTQGPHPTYDELLFRTSNGHALMAWIGSLFFEQSDRQQYVWLYGHGRNGKGSLTRVLQRIFGPSFATEQPPPRDDKFWTSGLLGKRLVVFPDCNHYSFTTTGLFKSLTGGDRVRIERKNHQPFDAELTCKFMFLSNERPRLSSQEADLRRAIFCEIDPIDKDFGPDYERLLWEEAPHFLEHCRRYYESVCPNHGSIPVNREATELIAAMAESDYQVVFDKYFVAVNDAGKLERDRAFVEPRRMKHILDQEGGDAAFKKHFREWMERTHGVRYAQIRDSDGGRAATRSYRWLGVRERSSMEELDDLL